MEDSFPLAFLDLLCNHNRNAWIFLPQLQSFFGSSLAHLESKLELSTKLRSAFCEFFFDVFFFILDYDSMCSETDFTQNKSIFMQLLESPIPPFTAATL